MIRALYLSHPTNPMPDDQAQNILERRIATTLGPSSPVSSFTWRYEVP